MSALEVINLSKHYPKFTLDNVSFSVGDGRIAGLIGRNGAGKTTTLKAIMRLISASGDVRVFGKSFTADEDSVKETVGYVGGGFRYYPSKTLASVRKVVSSFYTDWNDATYEKYLKTFNLDETKKIRELSEGMKVKFSLALAISHNAKLLIMDEPTSGLDPLSREEFCDIILSLVQSENITVLFSTHITSDLMRIADDIIYIADGKLVVSESLEELLAKYSLAHFTTAEEAEKAHSIGIKQVKNGWEGLIPKNSEPAGAVVSEATLDHIMIHLEYEKTRRNDND